MNVKNITPKNNLIQNTFPQNNLIINIVPKNEILEQPNFTFLETRTILQGQPIPWGLNWLITYPATFSFQGQRL